MGTVVGNQGRSFFFAAVGRSDCLCFEAARGILQQIHRLCGGGRRGKTRLVQEQREMKIEGGESRRRELTKWRLVGRRERGGGGEEEKSERERKKGRIVQPIQLAGRKGRRNITVFNTILSASTSYTYPKVSLYNSTLSLRFISFYSFLSRLLGHH